MPRELTIKLLEKTPDGIHVFQVSGSLGVEGSTGIQGLLDACLKEKVYKIVLDLQEVGFVSSAGMGAFLSAVGELRKKRGDVIFVKMQDKIMTVFKTLDVLDYFIVADDIAHAVERFRVGQLPQPPSLEELTGAAAERAAQAETAFGPALLSLLAAYTDILGTEAETSVKLTHIADVTANYLSLNQCAFVPLTETLGLVTTAARGSVPVPTAAIKGVLGEALAEKEILAVGQLPTMNKELARWAAESHARLFLPLGTSEQVSGVLVVGDKKDGNPFTNEERRLLRYLRTSLNLTLENHLLRSRLAGESPGDKREIGRKTMEMETLFTVSQALAEALETEEMLPTFLMMVTGQFSTDRAAALLAANDKGFEVGAARGLDEAVLAEFNLPPRGLIEILRTQSGPVITSVLAMTVDDRYRSQIKPFLDHGIAVMAPMRFKNDLIGVLGLGAKITGRDFELEELRLLDALANLAAVSVETARLLDKTKRNYSGLIRALISSVEAKDKFTHGHTERVTLYAAALADELGLDESYRQDLLFGAILHDVGYLGVPEEILRLTDDITEEQLAELRRHPLIGVNILQGIPFLRRALAAVRHHHESYDGSGYPDGLAGEDIPFIARIIAVADAYDAITRDRRYRKARSKEKALAEIKKNRKKQFDPAIADAFIKLVETGGLDNIKTKRRKPKE